MVLPKADPTAVRDLLEKRSNDSCKLVVSKRIAYKDRTPDDLLVQKALDDSKRQIKLSEGSVAGISISTWYRWLKWDFSQYVCTHRKIDMCDKYHYYNKALKPAIKVSVFSSFSPPHPNH